MVLFRSMPSTSVLSRESSQIEDDGTIDASCHIGPANNSTVRWAPCKMNHQHNGQCHMQPNSYSLIPPRVPHTLELEEGHYVLTFCDLDPIPEEHEGPVAIRTAVRWVTPREYYH